VRRTEWRATAALLFSLMAFGLMPGAFAFFPTGMFVGGDQYTAPRLIYSTWSLKQMDVNGNGNVDADEGVPVIFDSSSATGLTAEERALFRAGMEVWEQVPSAYIAFRFPFTINQQLETDIAIGASDSYNFVTFNADAVPDGVAGISAVSFITESGFYEFNGQVVPISGPTIIDADIALDPALLGTNDTIDVAGITAGTAKLPIRAVATTLTGLFIGLSFSPLSNYDFVAVPGSSVPLPVDPLVFNTGAGVVGVTPTMHPIGFFTNLGGGALALGQGDLAPDDIAGVTFLYPRGDQENFFTLSHEARTDALAGIPSVPIAGGYIRVWCDTDNNPDTPRVPMYDTITSLYEYLPDGVSQTSLSSRGGFFKLPKMFKQILALPPTDTLFSATYTVTLTEIQLDGTFASSGSSSGGTSGDTGGDTGGGGTGEEEKAAADNVENWDSTHRGVLNGGRGFEFTTGFPWQTFREGGLNIYAEAPDSGTPLYFDPARRQIVSADTSRTLSQMLPGTKPMFGKAVAETVCPLNLAASTLPVSEGPRLLRRFRDSVLLRTALGTALAEAYYRTGPAICRTLEAYPAAMGGMRMVLLAMEWVFTHVWVLLMAFGTVSLSVMVWRFRGRWGTSATLTIVALSALALYCEDSCAQFLKMSSEEIVWKSDEIVVGTVESVECRWTEKNQLVTDVTIRVDDNWKGKVNKSGLISFVQLGGQKDGVITYVHQYPAWQQGEEVLVFLRDNPTFGYMPVNGAGGKFNVVTDRLTGKKKIEAPSLPAQSNLQQLVSDMKKVEKSAAAVQKDAGEGENGEDGDVADPEAKKVYLDDLKGFVKRVDQELKRKSR